MLDFTEKNYGFDTLMIHAGTEPDSATNAVAMPIHQSNAYTFNSVEHAANLFALKEAGNIYTRIMNPTVDALERRVAALDGGIGAVAMSCGHASIFNTMLNLANTGDEIVASNSIYGGAVNLLGVTLNRIGIRVRFVDPDDLDAWRAAVNEKTKAFFVEIIGNPNVNLADLKAIGDIAHENGIPFVVDSTFTTPYLCKPIAFGADFVVHSATKYLSGHGTTMCGVTVDSGNFVFKDNPRFPLYNTPDESYHGVVFADLGAAAFITRLRVVLLRDVGACCAPFNAFLVIQGIETLSLRMQKHCESALTVAQFLKNHPAVDFVHYPGLEGDKYYERSKTYLSKGASGILTFGLKNPDRKAAAAFIDGLELFQHVANVGDCRSLAIHPATTTHSQLSDEQLAACGITSATIRLSIGLEDAADLIGDLEQAIGKAVSCCS